MSIELTRLVEALEKLLFETYYYRIELTVPNMLAELKISDELLVRMYGGVFNRVDVHSHDRRYLGLLLKYYVNALPEEFRTKAFTVIYKDAEKS